MKKSGQKALSVKLPPVKVGTSVKQGPVTVTRKKGK